MKKIILELDTLTCPSCMTKIEGALSQIAGVQKLKVLFNASKVKAEVEPEVQKETLQSTVEKLGYTVKNVKEKEL